MSHTVVTTRTTTTTTSSSSTTDGSFLNLGYVRTTGGLLKIAQVIALLIAFLCVHCAPGWTDYSAFRYFEVVTLWFLIAFAIFFLMYILRLQAKIPCINWTMTFAQVLFSYSFHLLFWDAPTYSYSRLHTVGDPAFTVVGPKLWNGLLKEYLGITEFLHYILGTVLVFIASIVAAVKAYGISALVAGSVFGFIATFLLAVSIWTSYKVTCGSQPTSAAV